MIQHGGTESQRKKKKVFSAPLCLCGERHLFTDMQRAGDRRPTPDERPTTEDHFEVK